MATTKIRSSAQLYIDASLDVNAHDIINATALSNGSAAAFKMDIGAVTGVWGYADVVNHDDEVLWTRRTWKGNVTLPKSAGNTDALSFGQYKNDDSLFYGYVPYLNDPTFYGGVYDGTYMSVPGIANGFMFCDEAAAVNNWVKIDGTTGNVLIETDTTFLLVPRYKLDVNGTIRLQGANALAFGGDTTSDYVASIADNGTATVLTRGTDIITMGTAGEPFKIQGSAAQCVSFYNSTTARVGWFGDGYNNGDMNLVCDAGSAILRTTKGNLSVTKDGCVGIGTVGETGETGLLQVFQPASVTVGTVSTVETTALVGTGTTFDTTLKIGDTITVDGETVRTIDSITDATNLTVSVAFANTASGKTYTIVGGAALQVFGNGSVYIGRANDTGTTYLHGKVTVNPYHRADCDFTVQGDADASLIVADSSADKVGIGTASPTTKLEVVGTVTATEFVGGGVGLTGLPNIFDQSLDTTDDVEFNTITMGGALYEKFITVTPGGATLATDATLGNIFKFVPDQAFVIANPTNLVAGQKILYIISSDATPRAVTYGAMFKAIGVTAPVTTVASKITTIGCLYDGTNMLILATGQEA